MGSSPPFRRIRHHALRRPRRREADPDMLRVLDCARRFLALRDQAAMASGSGNAGPPARTLGAAIAGDFLAFALERAAQELRAAVDAADGLTPAASLPDAMEDPAAESLEDPVPPSGPRPGHRQRM